MRQFFANQFPADLEESLVVAPEDVVNIDLLAGDLEGKADWEMADLTGGPDLST